MNDAERELISGLFQRIRSVETARRDPQAEEFIAEQVARQPHAPYAMAQTLVVQDRSIEAAQARIEQLERELAEARGEASASANDAPERSGSSPWGPRAQETMARAEAVRSGQPFGQRPMGPTTSESYSPPYGAPQPSYPPSQRYEEPSRGGGFLSGALQTAAGVAAGALIFQGARSLFGGNEASGGAGDAAKAEGAGAGGDAATGGIGDWYSGLFGGANDDNGNDRQDSAADGGDGDWT